MAILTTSSTSATSSCKDCTCSGNCNGECKCPCCSGGKCCKSQTMPGSLDTDPVCSLVEPGHCQLKPEFQPVKLLERTKVSPTSSVLRFELPNKSEPLNLPTCACILARAKIDGEEVIRPYTPISTNNLKGCFDLLVKDYGKGAKMSHCVCHDIKVGDTVEFKHGENNVKILAPFKEPKTIAMLVGGTGITPMIQALHAILGDDGEHKDSVEQVILMYGSKSSDDILAKDMLDRWSEKYGKKFILHHILSHEPQHSSWDGMRGHIDKEKIQKYLPTPNVGSDIMIFVCGPPPMYDAVCGPRDEKEKIGGSLGELGYTAKQVYKF